MSGEQQGIYRRVIIEPVGEGEKKNSTLFQINVIELCTKLVGLFKPMYTLVTAKVLFALQSINPTYRNVSLSWGLTWRLWSVWGQPERFRPVWGRWWRVAVLLADLAPQCPACSSADRRWEYGAGPPQPLCHHQMFPKNQAHSPTRATSENTWQSWDYTYTPMQQLDCLSYQLEYYLKKYSDGDNMVLVERPV